MEEIMDRVLGFMPNRGLFWAAVSMLVFSISVLYVARWLESLLILPWMREENLKKRQKIMQETREKEE